MYYAKTHRNHQSTICSHKNGVAQLLLGRELEDLKAGTLRLECLSMTLSNEDENNPRKFAGPGEIHFDENGWLEVVLYDQQYRFSAKSFFGERHLGGWIPQSELFDLSATDLSGMVWTAHDLTVSLDTHIARPGTVVRAKMHQLSSESSPERDGKDWLWLYFAERIDTPANVSTMTTVQESDNDRPLKGFERNIWAISFDGLNIRLRRRGAGFEINVHADSGSIQAGLETRIQEALWFCLGQPITADIVQYRRGDREEVIVYSRSRNEKIKTVTPPYVLNMVDAGSVLGEMFGKYLAYIAEYDADRFHPLSVLIRKVLRAQDGTIEEDALALSVAIEGVIHHGFEDFGEVEAAILEEVSRLESVLDVHLEMSILEKRMKGFFKTMRRPSMRSTLHTLVKLRIITEEQLKSWEDLRNVLAHGKEHSLTIHEFYGMLEHLRVMLSRLIFELIGYDGPYTDYGTSGYPTRMVGE